MRRILAVFLMVLALAGFSSVALAERDSIPGVGTTSVQQVTPARAAEGGTIDPFEHGTILPFKSTPVTQLPDQVGTISPFEHGDIGGIGTNEHGDIGGVGTK